MTDQGNLIDEVIEWDSNNPWQDLFYVGVGGRIVCSHGKKTPYGYTTPAEFNIDIDDQNWHSAPANISDRPLYFHVWKDSNYYYVQ